MPKKLFLCLLCGQQILYKNVVDHYRLVHPEWLTICHVETSTTTRDKQTVWFDTTTKREMVSKKHKNDNVYFMDMTEYDPYHRPILTRKSHRQIWNESQHLKPWHDPESMYCDVEFLEEYTGKSIYKDERCSNYYADEERV